MEVRYPDAWRKRLLSLECLVKALAKVRLNTERLQYEHAHAHQALLSGIIALIDRIVQHKDHEIMRSVSVYDEGTEALVALQSLPEKHDHFGRPGQ